VVKGVKQTFLKGTSFPAWEGRRGIWNSRREETEGGKKKERQSSLHSKLSADVTKAVEVRKGEHHEQLKKGLTPRRLTDEKALHHGRKGIAFEPSGPKGEKTTGEKNEVFFSTIRSIVGLAKQRGF